METKERDGIKATTEQVPALRGLDELNFAEFPLSLISTSGPSAASELVFEDVITDESTGREVRRKLSIQAPPNVGLPLPRDADVLLVLTRHAQRPDEEVLRRVPFQRGELLRVLGWDDSGQSYRRLDESLRRWTSVTLHYSNAWWDKCRQRWRTRSFHVLDEIELSGGQAAGGGGELDGPCSFTWGATVFESLRARNVRALDLDQYFRLTRAASRQAFRFLGKRFWQKQRLCFDLRIFCCEHLGFSRQHDIGGLKRAVLPVIEELESIGMLEPLAPYERFEKRRTGAWEILLVAKKGTSEAPQVSAAVHAVVQALLARGVSAPVAQRLAKDYPEARIRDKLQLLDRLTSRKNQAGLRSPAGFLVKAIENDYQADASGGHPVRPRPQQPRERLPAQSPATAVAAPVDELGLAARRLALLAPSERSALEQAAIHNCDAFHREALDRLRNQGGKLLEELTLKLVADYLQQHPLAAIASDPGRRTA